MIDIWTRAFAYVAIAVALASCTPVKPNAENLPSAMADDGWVFDSARNKLYEPSEIWTGYDSDPSKNTSLDWKIYQYFVRSAKYSPSLRELEAQRRHDSGMDHAVNDFLKIDATGVPENKRVVVVMGSHSMLRNDVWYARRARLGYALSRAGFYVVTGGGPGVMEAVHLGAYMAPYTETELDKAIGIIATASVPVMGSGKKQYELADYWQKSLEVVASFPNGGDSLGIPTWFYGHEGANAFAGHVAKYFSNALREEKICAVGVGGAIFAPGGPGTAQEVFMDAAENGYASYNWYSPMVFFSDRPEAVMMKDLVDRMTSPPYKALGMTAHMQEISQVLAFLEAHPPAPKAAVH